MVDNSKERGPQSKSSEHRTSPRYRLPSPPRSRDFARRKRHTRQGTPRRLKQGGCYVVTDCLPPLGTELTVTLEKIGDHIRAHARVVWASPDGGLALAFTSMEGEDFRILESWLSIFVATSWVAANRRRTQRVVMQTKVGVSGYDAEGARFTEDTYTDQISAFCCLVTLRTSTNRGQRLVLTNLETKETLECMVAYHEAKNDAWQVGLAFIVLNQPFWPVDFPSADWSLG